MSTDNLQHCSNARQILSSIGGTIQKANGAKNKSAAASAIASEYVKKSLGLNQASLDGAGPDKLKEYMETALMNCVLQLNAVNEVGQDAKSAKGQDFMKMVHVEKLVVKLQAKFRQKLAMKKLEKDIEAQKARLAKRALANTGASNEELALQEFKQRLAKKGLTPEGFFRTCDPEYKRSVPCEKFKSMIANFNLQLSRGQVSRLVLILDEDMEGNITLDEYYNALEAYNCSGEKHFATDGSDYYVSFEHRAMFKLLTTLKDRNISYQELFRSCDVNNDADVNIKELETVLTGLSAEFYQKDTQAIHNFFDIDKNNQCTEQEFMTQLAKAERLFTQHKERLAGRSGAAGDLRGTVSGFDDQTGMNAYIPRYNESSPRTQEELLTDFLVNEFSSKNIQPARIFSMADQRRTESVKFSVILDAMLKMMPHFTRDFVDQIPGAFGMSPSDMLSKNEFAMLFDMKAKLTQKAGPQVSALKKKNSMEKGGQDNFAILKYLAESMVKEGINAARLFKQADKNFNQVLTIDELKEQVKISLPDYFAGLNFKKLLKAFDLNGNGLVEQDEFVRMIEMAAGSSADTANFKKVSSAVGGGASQKKALQAAKDSGNSLTILDTVRPQDRLTHEEVINYLKGLLQCENRVQDPIDDIQVIFEKISAWKKKAGDLDAQEKFVAKSLKPKEKLKIHNIKTLTAKMKEIQKDVGFTDDEINIILYTSLDHDYFTNLLVMQGEFLKWFNLNFEGENREELDFLDNKQDIWMATTTLAMEVVSWYGRLKENQEVILTTKWWETLRYHHFGNEMTEAFKAKPELMKEMRAKFKEQNDKLSYFDLFQFIQHKLEIKLENWEEDALEGRLDRLGMAFIEFNEFNEFSMDYGLNWGEDLLETDLEDIMDAKMNLSYKDYVVTEADYFQSCPTMLNNEKAALAKCRELYGDLKKRKARKYLDADFGPKDATDTRGHRFAMYKDGNVPQKGYPEPEEVEWVYSEKLCDPGETPQFVDDGAGAADCIQGSLGDCWLISAMGVLVSRDELLMGGRRGMEYDNDMIVDKEIASLLCNGVYPPIFHRYRKKGLFVIRIFKNFNWIYVILDERIPVKIKDQLPVFGACKSAHEMWVALIEKAYAKMHGCYGNLISGYVDEGVLELTGFQPEKVLIRNESTGCFPHKMIEQFYGGKEGFWAFLMQRRQDNCLLGCSIKAEKGGQLIVDGQPTGLIKNHAYGLTDVLEFEDPYDKARPLRLLKLKNPWGHTEWKGAWGGDSPEAEKYKMLLEEYNKTLPPDEQWNQLADDDGIFFMSYSDWKETFSTLFLNIDFPEDWTGIRFKSAWSPSNSGGLPPTYTKDMLERYAKNPQFLVKPANDCEMMISLSQTGGRLPILHNNDYHGEKTYYDYPFQETLIYANVCVFHLGFGQRTLDAFDKAKLTYCSPIKRERENSGRMQLKGGEAYVIVPSAEIAGTTGEFYVSVYFNQMFRDVEVKRVFHPLDKNESKDEVLPYFIPEESEKSSSICPTWKLELVRESLKYMMTDEDTGAVASSDG